MGIATYSRIVFILLASLALFFVSQENYLFFHLIIEFAIIAIGVVVFVISVNTRTFAKNDFLLFIGSSFFFVSLIEFVHTLTYKGMSIFPGLTANVPTQLWIAGRYLLAISFLFAPLLIKRKLGEKGPYLLFLGFFIVTTDIFLSIFYLNIFPNAYVEGSGLTPFKIWSEYIISAIFLASLLFLWRGRGRIDRKVVSFMSFSVIFSILAEISFTQYASVYGFSNILGHIFVAISYYFIYRGLVKTLLKEPVYSLFKDLDEVNQKLSLLSSVDPLTGLFNRRHALERISAQFNIAKRFDKKFTLVMMDVDNFKSVNDEFGHMIGDRVLQKFGDILRSSFREVDVVGRYGGDEFIICPIEAGASVAHPAVLEVLKKVNETKMETDKGSLSFSVSAGICELTKEEELAEIMEIADDNLLRSKKMGKNLVVSNIPAV